MPLIFLQNKNFIIHTTKQQNIQFHDIKVFLLFLINPRDAFYWWELSFWSSKWRHGFSGSEHITWYISEHPFCSECFPKSKFQLILKRWMWYTQKSFINVLNDTASFTPDAKFCKTPPQYNAPHSLANPQTWANHFTVTSESITRSGCKGLVRALCFPSPFCFLLTQ